MALTDRIVKSFSGPVYSGTGQEFTPIPGSEYSALPKTPPFSEIGVSGVLRTRGVGYLYEEWLASLSTSRGKMVYREMRDNDAVIGSMFFALEMILRRAQWHMEPGPGKKGDDYGQFIDECFNDMSHTFEDFIAECVNMFVFGYSLFETVYKRRQGPKGKKASKFDDGLIGWRKFAPRAQESILYWIWDDEGGLQGAVQLAAPDYHTVPIPISRLLLFRTTSVKNNPEGRSLLRNCFRSWFFKRRIEEVEGIGIERDLCGIPVLYASAEALAAMGGQAAAEKLVSNIRVDDQAGIILPLAFDEKGNQLVKIELMRTAGQKQMNPSETIGRYNSDMLNTMLAGFVQFGQTSVGSRALHMSATQIFSLAITAFMDSIAAIINRIAIPRLMAMNSMDLSSAPKLVPGEIGVRDLEELSQYVYQLSQSGLTFFDKETTNYLRKTARLPEMPEDDEAGPEENPNQAPPPQLTPDQQAQAQVQGEPPDPNAPPAPAAPSAASPKTPPALKPKKPIAATPPSSQASAGEKLRQTA